MFQNSFLVNFYWVDINIMGHGEAIGQWEPDTSPPWVVWYGNDSLTVACFIYVQMFTDRPDSETVDERLKPDFIVDYLSRFQRAIVVYLEFLIFTKKIEVTARCSSHAN